MYAKIVHDAFCEEPEDFEIKIFQFSSKYSFGTPHNYDDKSEIIEDFNEDEFNIFLLKAYDHGGLSLSLTNEYPYNCGWDSYGYLVAPKELKFSVLKSYLDTYNNWLNGYCFGWIVCEEEDLFNAKGEFVTKYENEIDSCWGYYGYDEAICGLEESGYKDIKIIEKN